MIEDNLKKTPSEVKKLRRNIHFWRSWLCWRVLLIKEPLIENSFIKVQLEEVEISAVIREKLTMAMKKGKRLAQQRDNLKQSMDEKVAEQ